MVLSLFLKKCSSLSRSTHVCFAGLLAVMLVFPAIASAEETHALVAENSSAPKAQALGVELVASSITTISTPADLRAFAESVNNDSVSYKGVTVTLANDIDMTGEEWTPIGVATAFSRVTSEGAQVEDTGLGKRGTDYSAIIEGSFFNGTFDGQNHTISGLDSKNLSESARQNENLQALFNIVDTDGIVKDLAVHSTLSGTNTVAGIVAINRGLVSGCTFKGSIGSDTKHTSLYDDPAASSSGGIVGTNYGTVESCITLEGTTIYRGGAIAGGIVGRCYGTIKECENRAVITNGDTLYPDMWTAIGGIGGIAGVTDYRIVPEGRTPLVEDCVSFGSISSYQTSGGIVGQHNCGTVKNCINETLATGVAGGGNMLGGIVGSMSKPSGTQTPTTVDSCTNKTNVASENGAYIGGIVGYAVIMGASGDGLVISNCLNTGSVSGRNIIGGIVGNNGSNNLSKCFNTGNVTCTGSENASAVSPDESGGIAGTNGGKISSCGNVGSITYTKLENVRHVYLGGIAGSTVNMIARSYNMGRVNVEADVNFARQNVNVSGIAAGLRLLDRTSNYYCAEFAGDAIAQDATASIPVFGITAQEMLDQQAIAGMPALFGEDSPWTAVHFIESSDIASTLTTASTTRLVLSPPYLADAGAQDAKMTSTTAALWSDEVFSITLPEGEGFEAKPLANQRNKVLNSGDFGFTVAIGEGYDGASMIVRANGIVLNADENGNYYIRNIETDQTISVEGVVKRSVDPTSDASRLAKTGDAAGVTISLAALGFFTAFVCLYFARRKA